MFFHFYQSIIRPIIFRFDPEFVHEATMKFLHIVGRSKLSFILKQHVDPHPVEIMGLKFPNPIGLAAGLDKNGIAVDGLGKIGFGFIEVGTVTPVSQPGNPKKRLFRLVAANGIINRMGFNNDGVDALIQNIHDHKFKGILGINIGKNKTTPLEKSIDDYLICMEKVYQYADYITVNISSPNTPNLRKLQFGEMFDDLLHTLKNKQADLAKLHDKYVPLVVKIAPDVSDDELKQIADSLLKNKIDGVIATNTTITRDIVYGQPHAYEEGGLSGRPIQQKSTDVIRKLHGFLNDEIPIIGVGGVDSVMSAKEKFDAGAKLVQVYTGFIYNGPNLIPTIVNNL